MSIITITLDNNENGHYFAGQTLSGTVQLNLRKAIKCKGFSLTIEGSAECTFSEYKIGKTINFIGRESYLNYVTYMIGSKDGESMKIEAGTRTFRFTYVLPSNLPYSVERAFGSIRYSVKAKLDIPWRFNINAEKDIKICQNDDLNLYPCLKIPYENRHIAQCCLFPTKPLFFKVSIPYSGYVRGDTINVAINLINSSYLTLWVKIELVEKTLYTFRGAYFKQHCTRNTMAKAVSHGIEKDKKANFIQELVIPSTLENTNVFSCSIVQTTYEIKVTLMNPFWTISPKVRIPITLGSIPLTFNDDFHPTQ